MPVSSLSYLRFSNSGQIALITVFLIGSFVLLIALTLAFLSISAITSNYAARSASVAFSVANAGVQDGVLKIVRGKTSSGNYSINIDNYLATVAIENDPSINQVTVTASSTVGSSQSSVRALLSVVSSTGQVNIISWRRM